MSRSRRHAPADWRPGSTRVRYTADDGDPSILDHEGTFVGNSQPLPGVPAGRWLGVLVQFDGEDRPLDVDPADLEPLP